MDFIEVKASYLIPGVQNHDIIVCKIQLRELPRHLLCLKLVEHIVSGHCVRLKQCYCTYQATDEK